MNRKVTYKQIESTIIILNKLKTEMCQKHCRKGFNKGFCESCEFGEESPENEFSGGWNCSIENVLIDLNHHLEDMKGEKHKRHCPYCGKEMKAATKFSWKNEELGILTIPCRPEEYHICSCGFELISYSLALRVDDAEQREKQAMEKKKCKFLAFIAMLKEKFNGKPR